MRQGLRLNYAVPGRGLACARLTLGMELPEWKLYEQQIYAKLKAGVAADAEVTFDERGSQRLPGRFSRVDRQIDVIVRGSFAGLPGIHTMIVDCKLVGRRLDVTHVEAFAGLLDDVNVTLGLLVTAEGFSEAAKQRAAAIRGMQLDVVELDELQKWLPRRPTVGMTAGASTATLTYCDDEGVIHTSTVDTALARRIVTELRYGANAEDGQ